MRYISYVVVAVAVAAAVLIAVFMTPKPPTTTPATPPQQTAATAPAARPAPTPGPNDENTLLLELKDGFVEIEMLPNLAPNHVARIGELANEGFYNGVPFHRVMDGFMAQTGDGQNFNGTGGSKYPNLKQEFSSVQFTRGIVGMARRGDSVDSANSQFFIMFAEASSLNNQYTVIGEVVQGMDVVDKLKKASPGSQGGTVTDPDKMTRVQVAADIK